ncbi:MAG: Wzz/FepE/Etk N-terminal domain-containing protein [Clostridia bacterium]|nr:Wzz/FepE/Etk N-terminal domain-containing protein [Clostridia bacterium]
MSERRQTPYLPKEGNPPAINEVQGPDMADADTIDLVELFYRLLDGWKSILAFTLLGALLAFGYTNWFMKPQYRAKSTIYVLSNKESVINMSDLQIGTALTGDYIKVFDMWEVAEQVLQKLKLPYSYSGLRGMISVTNATNTRMLDISVTSNSA